MSRWIRHLHPSGYESFVRDKKRIAFYSAISLKEIGNAYSSGAPGFSFLYFVCLGLVSCVPNVTSVSGLSIFDCPVLSNVYYTGRHVAPLIISIPNERFFALFHAAFLVKCLILSDQDSNSRSFALDTSMITITRPRGTQFCIQRTVMRIDKNTIIFFNCTYYFIGFLLKQ